jgi:hypothetical protein
MVENPHRFMRLIEHLTTGRDRLLEWREPLATGRAAVVLTGQQPALLGGPLYTLYKTMTAIEAARRMRESGRPAIAAFWCVGDDTDHDEVGFSSWPRHGAAPRRIRDDIRTHGARIGSLPRSRFDPALNHLREDWPAADPWSVLDLLLAPDGPPTWSSFLLEALDRLAGGEPLLLIDGNDPEVIDASQVWLRRFLTERRGMAAEIQLLAGETAKRGNEPALTGQEAERALFVIDGEGRRPVELDEVPDRTARLLPNVVLRPALQEHLLPVARVVCGEGEIAYRTLLGPVYERVGKAPAPLMRRFAATLLPPAWAGEEGAPDPGRTLDDPDDALEAWAQEVIDTDLLAELAALRSDLSGRFLTLGSRLAWTDRSLAQVLDSVAGKVDYQVTRIEEAVRSKARASLYRRDPNLGNLREFLLPRGKAQERSFTFWTPILWEGMHGLDGLRAAVRRWFDRGERGHAILALEEGRGS